MSFSRTFRFALVSLACTLLPLAARAQETAGKPPGAKGDIVHWIEDAEKKLVELASATPEAKYAWRPGKDVRSVGEVFTHVVAANYRIPSFVGVKAPEGVKLEGLDKSLTKKADIEKALTDSFAHLKKAVSDTPDADFDKPAELFGRKTTTRNAYLLLLSHAHEHLGQSIAYARSNKITPPWTARRNAKKAEAEKAPPKVN